jgi:C2 domain
VYTHQRTISTFSDPFVTTYLLETERDQPIGHHSERILHQFLTKTQHTTLKPEWTDAVADDFVFNYDFFDRYVYHVFSVYSVLISTYLPPACVYISVSTHMARSKRLDLRFEVWDEDKFTNNDFIGQATLTLDAHVQDNTEFERWLALLPKFGTTSHGVCKGQLHVRILFRSGQQQVAAT